MSLRRSAIAVSAPEETVIILWPSAEDLPPQMRLWAEEAGIR